MKYAILPQHLADRRADRRQRPGRDGHVRRDPARHDRGRPRRRGRAERARSCAGGARHRDRGRRLPREPRHSAVAGGGAGARDQLEPVHRDLAEPEARAATTASCGSRCSGISWFWFFGAIFLAQLPAFTKDVLGGDEHVVTLLLALFSVGIGVGSLLCERLSGRKIEIGLVPFGSIGLTVFAIDLCSLREHLTAPAQRGHRRVPRDGRALARRGRPRAGRRLRRLLHRAAVRADPDALGAGAPLAHHRREQHPERALHRRRRGRRDRAARAGLTIPQLFLVAGAAERRSSRSTSTRWCPSS